MIDSIALAHIERTGTERERALASAVLTLVKSNSMAELLLGRMREALQLAVTIVSPTDETKVNEQAIDTFVELALELADNRATTQAFRTWARAQGAASLAAEGGKPREYLVEVAREIMKLPAKDGAARALVKMDLERVMMASESTIQNALLEEEEAQPKEPA